MPTSRLQILMEARNKASREVKQLSKDLSGLDRAAGVAAGGFSAFAAAAGLAGVAGAAGLAFQLGTIGAQAQQLEDSFQQLARTQNQSADEMLAGMRRASRGMVSDSDLILAANRAMLLGVANNSEELGALLEIARVRGRAMGADLTQAFNDIVTGIGRMSPLILDNLGIVVDQAAANEAYASSLGRSVDSLTDAEQKQALLNAVIADSADLLSESGGAALNNAEKVNTLAAAWRNLREEIGQALAGPASDTAGAFAQLTQQAADFLSTWNDDAASRQLQDLVYRAGLLKTEIARLERVSFFPGLASWLETDRDKLAALNLEMLNLIEYGFGAEQTADSVAEIGDAAAGAAGDVDKLNDALARAIGRAQGLAVGLVDELGETGALGLSKEFSNELTAQVGLWRLQGRTADEISNVLMPAYLDKLQGVSDELNTSEQRTRGISKAARDAERAFGNLKSKVAGVLQDALSPGVGVDPADFLPRQDAVNEDAKRLADIAVNGWNSPWVDYFRSEFPGLWAQYFSGAMEGGDVQAQAAQLLKEFQAGLRPELIDRGRAKELVKQMILGEQNMAQLAEDLARELAPELGVGFGQALSSAQAALGVSDAAQSGVSAGESFGDGAINGLTSSNKGNAFVDGFLSQIGARFASIRSAGSDAGDQWGSGFLETVGDSIPQALIDILTFRVTPAVLSSIQQQQTLQGAQ